MNRSFKFDDCSKWAGRGPPASSEAAYPRWTAVPWPRRLTGGQDETETATASLPRGRAAGFPVTFRPPGSIDTDRTDSRRHAS